jgi:hypothetical protein
MSLPLPGTRVASIKRTSPPVGVQASPVATPGTLVRIATSLLEPPRPENGGQSAAVDAHALDAAFGDAHGDMAADGADQPLQIAHAGLVRVVADDRPDGVLGALDDLHAVAHGAGNGIEPVGGGDEHHLGEIEGNAEIIVAPYNRKLLLNRMQPYARLSC